MTSVAHEQEALPIRIPLLKGLLGYRVMVVRRADEQKIAAIENLSELKALTAVQGFGWVDVQILEANHFKVEASAWYQSIYKSLAAGYYDYYPRSILEAWSELDQRPNPALVIDKKHLLYYPTAIYFFVNKNNGKLAERLSYGLEQALADGSFDQHFYALPRHRKALTLVNALQRRLHVLDNPLLPQATPLTDQRLWLRLDAIK